MSRRTEFKAISLEGNPTALSRGQVKIKLFFEGRTQSDYAECFLNLDLGKSRAELREKDPEYRAALIRALSR